MKITTILLGLLLFAGLYAQDPSAGDAPSLQNETDSISYFIGLALGFDFQSAPFALNGDLIAEGMQKALKGETSHTPQESQQVLRQLQTAMAAREEAKARIVAEEALAGNLTFLEENGKRDGVVTTESGLQYEVLVAGNGPHPADTSQVTVHYEGSLLDGTIFDSSYQRGESITFGLNQVIPGWTEGVQLMPVGSTYRFYIPSDLAYGARAQGQIPANSLLIFKVELLGIE
ncbi:MAG: FKBP-type peptidyl-prolyl cis-trans isomerase [Bacteroidales bacterium]